MTPDAGSVPKRWLLYLNEMYPPVQRFFLALFLTCAVAISAHGLAGARFQITELCVGTVTTFLFLMYYRIFDEFKDYDVDLLFFRDRPLPSGRVTKRDLKILGWGCAIIMVVVNALFAPQSLIYFALLMAFSVLMIYNFFAWDLIAGNRVLAFITHVPVVLLLNLYLISLGSDSPVWIVAFWFFLQGGVFEFARKTRAPHEEVKEYQTLSSMLGYRGSIGVAILFVLAQVALLEQFSDLYRLGAISTSVQFAWFMFVIAVFVRFLLNPSRGSAHLRRTAEFFSAGVSSVPVIDWIVAEWVR